MHLESRYGPLCRRQVERPVSNAVRGVHQCAAVEEEADGGAMVPPRCAVEGRAGDIVLVLQVGAGVEQQLDNLCVSKPNETFIVKKGSETRSEAVDTEYAVGGLARN